MSKYIPIIGLIPGQGTTKCYYIAGNPVDTGLGANALVVARPSIFYIGRNRRRSIWMVGDSSSRHILSQIFRCPQLLKNLEIQDGTGTHSTSIHRERNGAHESRRSCRQILLSGTYSFQPPDHDQDILTYDPAYRGKVGKFARYLSHQNTVSLLSLKARSTPAFREFFRV